MGPNRTYDEVMSRLLLVRHGRTVLNEQRRTQGASDSPLTDEGRAGARVTARYLADLPLHRAYLSPMGRVTETADLLLADRPQVGRTVLEGLREYHYGIYDGGPDEQMRQALDPFTHVPAVLAGTHPGAPGGIAASDYLAQLDAALARILADLADDAAAGRPDAQVLVVSHGMTIMTLAARWLGPQVLNMGPMANCSVTTVEVDPARPLEPRLIGWAVDPGGQGVTFEHLNLGEALDGVRLAPIDLGHPEGRGA